MFSFASWKNSGWETLSSQDMYEFVCLILQADFPTDALREALIALYNRGETEGEILGAWEALSPKEQSPIGLTNEVVDVCGTGGDGLGTFNISTASAFLAWSCGLPIVKHGNRAVSSNSGSSDFTAALQINIPQDLEGAREFYRKYKLAFLYAPFFYPQLARIAAIRKSIPHRTLFNILGPLLNPWRPCYQLMGIADERMVIPVVNAVRQRNQHRVFCAVHGTMGMDEINLLGHAQLTWVREGSISTEAVDPADFGYERGTLADIQGGSAQANAKRFMQTLRGHSQPLDHTLHWNTALILRVWNDKLSWIEALLEVQKVVSSGTALRKWESLKDV